MKLHKTLSEINSIKNPVLTIGSFDGVHIGHQKILSILKAEAKKIGGETVVITFYPHPRQVLNPVNSIKLLNTLEEKANLIEKFGIDHFVVIPFNTDFKDSSPESYIADFLVAQFRAKVIVIGYDHRFGKDREGNIDLLKKLSAKYKYKILEIEAKEVDEIVVSSTKVRNALVAGKLDKANQLLGYDYIISGIVMEGDQLGRKIGFPTCNIEPTEKEKLIPHDGVYAVHANVSGKRYQGMLYIGKRPTFDMSSQRRIEVNIFDFNENVYGEMIELELVSFIRQDKAFSNIDDLIVQLKDDEEKSKDFFSNSKNNDD